MSKKYYIYVNKEKFEVSKEVYKEYYKSKEFERYFMYKKKQGKVIINNEEVIFKDSLEVSFEKLQETGFDILDDFDLEEKVLLNIDINILKEALSKLTNNEYKIIIGIFFKEKTENELSKELKFSRNRIKYLKNKILKKLKQII